MSEECDKLVRMSKELSVHLDKMLDGVEKVQKMEKIVGNILKENAELRRINDALIVLAKKEKKRAKELEDELRKLYQQIKWR